MSYSMYQLHLTMSSFSPCSHMIYLGLATDQYVYLTVFYVVKLIIRTVSSMANSIGKTPLEAQGRGQQLHVIVLSVIHTLLLKLVQLIPKVKPLA